MSKWDHINTAEINEHKLSLKFMNKGQDEGIPNYILGEVSIRVSDVSQRYKVVILERIKDRTMGDTKKWSMINYKTVKEFFYNDLFKRITGRTLEKFDNTIFANERFKKHMGPQRAYLRLLRSFNGVVGG